MEKQSSWMERRVEGIGSRLGYQKAGTPLPPIRSQSSLGTHGNPWAMTDPALKQMNPMKRGPRAKYFPTGYRQRAAAGNNDIQNVPSLTVTPLPVIKNTSRHTTPNLSMRKQAKKVTISDAPSEVISEIGDKVTEPVELAPAREFRSAPPTVLRTASEIQEATRSTEAPPAPNPEPVVSEKAKEVGVTDIPASVDTPEKIDPGDEKVESPKEVIEIVQEPVVIEDTDNQDNIKKENFIVKATLDSKEPENKDDAQQSEKVEEQYNVESATPKTEVATEKPTEEDKPSSDPTTDEPREDDQADDDEEQQEIAHAYKQESEERMRQLLQYKTILKGEPTDTVQQHSRVLRIFLSSTFSDTKGERNYLARLAYPQLQEWCQSLGLEFQVVDMRWGVTQDAVLDHATTSICLQQIAECQRLSRGTNFVAFLGNRYGYQSPPTTIPQSEMSILLEIAAAKSIPNGGLLNAWYKLDENAMPPTYVLRKISSILEDFENKQKGQDARLLALDAWHQISGQLLEGLRQSAQIAIAEGRLPPEALYKHQKSVTEQEIDKGIIENKNPRALFFMRTLDGLYESLSDPIAHKFIDLTTDGRGKPHINRFSENRLNEIKTAIREKIPQEDAFSYDLSWGSIALNAQEYQDVDAYLNQFCDDFVNGVKRMTERELQLANVPQVVDEVLFHTQFSGKRVATFCGRLDVLKIIREQLENTDQESSPIVIYGRSGCGKTSVISMVARHVNEWLQNDTVIVVRFLGTTPTSTKICPMLQSVCTQLCSVYGLDSKDQFEIPMDLFQHFQDILEQISQKIHNGTTKEPLVLLFDSLDQLSSVDSAHYLTWLPKSLPPYVKIVTSTLEHEYGILQTLRKSMPADATYIKVDNLTDTTTDELVSVYLERNGRTLTKNQKLELTKVFEDNTHPIYIRLLMDQAKRLTSFDSLDAATLPLNAEMAMKALFDSLEDMFGRTFVSHAFTYLTICDGGMSEREIEDALSLDDEVLNEVYEFHDPPIQHSIRVPPLMWARLAAQVEQYLTEHDVDGVTTVTWYHMLFQRYAMMRYSNPKAYQGVLQNCFERIKELFTHTGKVCRTIALTKRKKEIKEADRGVAHYPLVETGKRKLMLLPSILKNCRSANMTKDIFCNLPWLMTKLKGTSYRALKQDFNYMKANDTEAKIILDTLNMGSSVFQDDTNLLPYELVARIPKVSLPDMPNIERLIEQCYAFLDSQANVKAQLMPYKPCLPAPNGLLKTTIHGPTDLLDVYDGRFALTRGTVSGFQVWNLDSLELQHYLCDGNKVESNITYQDETSKLVAQTYKTTLNLWDIESGSVVKTMNVFPNAVDSEKTPLKWAIEVFCVSASKHMCLVKIIASFLVPNKNTRLLLCDLDSSKVSPIRLDLDISRREVIVGAQFIQNDSTILVWCNDSVSHLPYILFVDTETLETLRTLPVGFNHRGQKLKLHHDNYYFHDSKPYFLIAGRMFNFVAVDLEKRERMNVMKDTFADAKVADVAWYKDGAVMATFHQRTKCARLLVYNEEFKPIGDITIFKGHPRVLRQVPDTALFAVGYTYIGLVEIWNVDNSTLMYSLKAHSASINTIIFANEGRSMFTASENKAVKVWAIDYALGVNIKSNRAPGALGEEDQTATEYNRIIPLFRAIKQEEVYTTNVEQILVLRGGDEFVSTYEDKAPVIWSMENGVKMRMLETMPDHAGTRKVVESSEGCFLYGLSSSLEDANDNVYATRLQKWNISSGKLLATSLQLSAPNDAAIALFPESGAIGVLVRMDTEAHILVLEPNKLDLVKIHHIDRFIRDDMLKISADETVALTTNTRNSIVVWLLEEATVKGEGGEAEGGEKAGSHGTEQETMMEAAIWETPFLHLPQRTQPTATLMVEKHSIIIGVHQGALKYQELTKAMAGPAEDMKMTRFYEDRQPGIGSEIWDLAPFPDGRHLLSVGNDKSYKIVDMVDKKTVFVCSRAHGGRIRCCDVSPDGKMVVTGGRDKHIRLWYAFEGRQICNVNMYEDVYALKFALNGRAIVALIHKFGERRLAMFRITGDAFTA